MNLTKAQLQFLLDAIDLFEDYGEYTSSDGKYTLSEQEVDDTIEMIQTELNK